jgi:hypothetical protein
MKKVAVACRTSQVTKGEAAEEALHSQYAYNLDVVGHTKRYSASSGIQ